MAIMHDFVNGLFDDRMNSSFLQRVGYELYMHPDAVEEDLLRQVNAKAQEYTEEFGHAAMALVQLSDQILRDKFSPEEPGVGFHAPSLLKAWEHLRSFVYSKDQSGGKVPISELRKQSFFQNSEIKKFLLTSFPKGLSWEELKPLTIQNVKEPERSLRKGPHEQVDLADIFVDVMGVANAPRKYFSLVFDDLGEWIGLSDDPDFLQYQRMFLSAIRHDLRNVIGIPGRTFGWVLYRPLGNNKIFIEQIQTDYLNVIPKIISRVRRGLGGGEVRQGLPEQFSLRNAWRHMEQMFGEENLLRWSDALTKAVENYFEILLAAFLEEFRGHEIFLSSRELLADSSEELGLNPGEKDGVVPADYDSVPPKWGFESVDVESDTGAPYKVWRKYNASYFSFFKQLGAWD